jgi:hypothetical protein
MNIPMNKIEIVRHTHGHFEITVYGLYGEKLRHVMAPMWLKTEGKRRKWALEQAAQWAERFYVHFDGKIWD